MPLRNYMPLRKHYVTFSTYLQHNPILDGEAVPARDFLKMDHFTRNRRTARQSNIPIPQGIVAYSDLKITSLKACPKQS